MTLEQIAQIANTTLDDENSVIFSNYKEAIERWLNSAEFSMGGGGKFSKLYPPLLNPAQINYANSDPVLCWILNIPLPNTFDFIVFGSHAASLHSAVPAFMGICGAFNIALNRKKIDKEKGANAASTNTNRQNYIDIFKNLLLVPQAKEKLGFKKCFLQLSDFLLDDDAAKFYALVPRKDALLVTRDPISALKAVCHVQNRPDLMLLGGEVFGAGVNFSISTKDYYDRNLKYSNSDDLEKDKKYEPVLSSDKNIFGDAPLLSKGKIKRWLLDREQTFHDGQVFKLLKDRIYRLKIKLTSDFINASATMKELSQFFDLDYKDSDLYNKRVSDLKYFTPLRIYANATMPLFSEIAEPLSDDKDLDASKRLRITKEEAKNSIILHLSTHFDKRVLITKNKGAQSSGDISEYFSTLGDDFVVFLENPSLRANFLADKELIKKAQFYIDKASKEILQKAKNEKTKHLKEKDILEFLAKNKDLRDLCALVLKAHLSFLRAYKPDILENFKFYNDFLLLCKDDKNIEICDEYKDEIEKMKKFGLDKLLF